MADHRLSASLRDVDRGRGFRPRLPALVLAASLGASLACPVGSNRIIGVTSGGGGGSGGSGGGGGGGGSSALVGSWRHLSTFFTMDGETIVSETRWSFGGGGSCQKDLIQTFVNAGFATTDTRFCTYTADASSVTVTFDGSTVATRFSYSFSGGTLILDGFAFSRFA